VPAFATQIGTGDTYTLQTSDVGDYVFAEVSYSGNSGRTLAFYSKKAVW